MRSILDSAGILIAVGFIIVPAHGVPAPPPPLDEWIEDLGHPDAARRNDAKLKLQRVGEPALEKVKKAAKEHAKPLVRTVAASIASAIERGEIVAIGTGSNYWFNRVAFTDDGRHALVTGGAVITMDLLEGRETGRDLEMQFARIGLAISFDGKLFATGHQHDNIIRIGDVKTRKVTQTLEGHKAGVHAVAFAASGDRLVSGSLDGTIRLWDLKTGKEWKQFPNTDPVRSIDYAAGGKRILSGHVAGKGEAFARLWDIESGKEIQVLKGHTKEITGVFLLPGGKQAVSSAMDGDAIVWNLDTGKEVRRVNQAGGIYGAALSPDGKRLLTAGFGDRTVRLWDIESGKEIKSFPEHGAAALGVAFSKDGFYALSSDARATVRLWRLPKQ